MTAEVLNDIRMRTKIKTRIFGHYAKKLGPQLGFIWGFWAQL
jgi:hypothetical protein